MRIRDVQTRINEMIAICKKTNSKQVAPIYITSKPGMGKSQLVRELALKNKMNLYDARLAQFAPEDLRGVPYPNKENRTTEWFTPAFFPRNDDWGILFLDELDKAKPAVQNAALQLFLDRKLGEYCLNNKIFILAAGNTLNDNSFSIPLSSALNNRMLHIEMETDSGDWIKWASENIGTEKNPISKIEEDVIGFMQFKPDLLHSFNEKERAWPSPRTWEFLSNLIRISNKLKDNEVINLTSMAVGTNAAREFYAYRKIYKDIDPKKILKGEYPNMKNAEVSFSYALATCIGFHVKNNGLKDKSEAKNCLNFIDKFSEEFRIISLRLMLMRNQLNNKLNEWCKEETETVLNGIFDKIVDNN